MKLVALRAEHILGLEDLNAFQKDVPISVEYAVSLEEGGGWAVLEGEKPIMCGGIAQSLPGCGHAWTILTRRWRRYARGIHEAVEMYLDTSDFERIESVVHCDHAAGHVWLKRLGFELECPRMRKWFNGNDYALYARVR